MGGRGQAVAVASLLIVGGFASAAVMGGLRPVGLIAGALVLIAVFALALIDSRHLPTCVIGIWFFGPLLRRLIDWQAGGYTSLTVLSLLPMLSTLTLMIPAWPRLGLLPRALRLPLILIALPVVAAATLGFVRYGPAAAPAALGWLVPLLFTVHAALHARPETALGDHRRTIRVTVGLAAVAAAYAWYQFFFIPPWDALWLVESGMMTSMGQPEPMKMRVWGPMNSAGPAAVVWALAAVAAFADRTWPTIWRATCLALILGALLMTLGRTAWIMTLAGLLMYAALSPGLHRVRNAAALTIMFVIIVIVLPWLPGGEQVWDRAATFGDLSQDTSFRGRLSVANSMYRQVIANPLGIGLGHESAGKLAGTSVGMEAMDNGYGAMVVSFGLLGSVSVFSGIALLGRSLLRRMNEPLPRLAAAMLAALAIGTVAAPLIGGLTGILFWLTCGQSFAATTRRTDMPVLHVRRTSSPATK